MKAIHAALAALSLMVMTATPMAASETAPHFIVVHMEGEVIGTYETCLSDPCDGQADESSTGLWHADVYEFLPRDGCERPEFGTIEIVGPHIGGSTGEDEGFGGADGAVMHLGATFVGGFGWSFDGGEGAFSLGTLSVDFSGSGVFPFDGASTSFEAAGAGIDRRATGSAPC